MELFLRRLRLIIVFPLALTLLLLEGVTQREIPAKTWIPRELAIMRDFYIFNWSEE